MKRTPYVEYTAGWYLRLERWMRFDDQTKKRVIGVVMSTKPLTFLLLLAGIGLAGYIVFSALTAGGGA